MPNNYGRNQRNNPYMVETYAVKFHHSMAGLLWRWRTELTLITIAAWACWRLATLITLTWSLTVLGAVAATALAVPHHAGTWPGTPGAWSPGTGSSGSATKPGCTPAPDGSRPSAGSAPPKSANAPGSSAAPGSAPMTSTPTSKRSPPPATPAKPGHPQQEMVPARHPRHRAARPARHHPHRPVPIHSQTTTGHGARRHTPPPRHYPGRQAHHPAVPRGPITIDGLGAFAVIRSEPYGPQALIKLAWDNLAVIAPRDITWTAISPATALFVHGYQPCGMRRQGHHLRRPRPARPDLGPPGPPLAHPVTP